MKTHTLHVHGMHCASCVVLTEESLSGAPGVTKIEVSLKHHTVTVTGDLPESAAETAALLSPRMPAEYSLAAERVRTGVAWREFYYALPIAAVLIAGFILLQKTGIVSANIGSTTSLGTALVIGLIASVSTCLAVVGGLVLSVSASYAKTGETIRPQALFHVGRLVGFFVLGGLLGLIGQSLQLTVTGTAVLSIIVGVIMLILGFNLLDITRHAHRFQLRLPGFAGAWVRRLATANHAVIPLAIGAATFFLPCGFTQSMQAYALTTGSFMSGGLTMLIFALGTLPVLALLSFSAFSIATKPWRGIFFKTAGTLVIALAVINILGSLAVTGVINPVF